MCLVVVQQRRDDMHNGRGGGRGSSTCLHLRLHLRLATTKKSTQYRERVSMFSQGAYELATISCEYVRILEDLSILLAGYGSWIVYKSSAGSAEQSGQKSGVSYIEICVQLLYDTSLRIS